MDWHAVGLLDLSAPAAKHIRSAALWKSQGVRYQYLRGEVIPFKAVPEGYPFASDVAPEWSFEHQACSPPMPGKTCDYTEASAGIHRGGVSMKEQEITARAERAVIVALPEKERRRGGRVKMSRPLLARPSDPQYMEEVQTTLNTSRDGLYFTTRAKHYHVGMRLSVTLGYAPTDRCNTASFGEIVRIERLKDGSFGIAVQILLR